MMLTNERIAEIAKLAIRLHHISSCAAITSSGETVFHHTFVDAILSAMNDVTAELLRYQTADKQPVVAVLAQQVEVMKEEAKGAEQRTKLIFNAKNHWADRARAAERRVEELESAALVPGVLHCAKCQFQLTKTNLYMKSGTVGPGDSKTEPCPNGCGPLWPVTWKQYATDAYAQMDRYFDECEELKKRLPQPELGEVLITVSGFTGCGKSAVAGEIEIALRAIGLPVVWANGDAEKRMTGADWLTALEMYKPRVRIVEQNIVRTTGNAEGGS